MKHKIIVRFRIELLNIEPTIWRCIEIPATSSFWDLHVAIQDAMGWLGYHYHGFTLVSKEEQKRIKIGIPDDNRGEVIPCWKVLVKDYISDLGTELLYEYDFGDGWVHKIRLEGLFLQEKKLKYPRCIGGERACPPEDCGGVDGYYNLLEILSDSKHEEYNEMSDWLKNHAKNYYPYIASEFNPNTVKFHDPKKLLKNIIT